MSLKRTVKTKINSESELNNQTAENIRSALSASKKYSQDEFTFRINERENERETTKYNNVTQCFYKTKGKNSKSSNEINEDLRVSLTKKEEEGNKSKTKNMEFNFKKMKTLNLDVKDDSIEIDNIKFILEDFSSFAFLSGSKNFESGMSSLPSFKFTQGQRKKSYQEDFSQRSKFQFDFNSEFNSIDVNQMNSDREKKMDTTTEHVKSYYETTFESLKKVKKIQKMNQESCRINYFDTQVLENEIFLQNKHLAVFDLDDTLVHSEINPENETFDYMINCLLKNKNTKIGVNIRPFLKEALQEIRKHYIIVVFSSNSKPFSDLILNHIDPQGTLFAMRLYKHDCTVFKLENEIFYIKDLRIFKTIPLNRIVIIDKSIISFALQIENGIPILPFVNNKQDNELQILVNYLTYLYKYEDIVDENRKIFGLMNMLTETNLSKQANDTEEIYESSDLNSYRTEESGRKEKIGSVEDDKNKSAIKDIKKIEKIEPTNFYKINNLNVNYIKHNFNSNSSYESNSLLSCLILLNKGAHCDSIQNTNTFISFDTNRSDSENSERKNI